MSKRQTQRILDKLEETAEIWVSRPDHNGPNAPNYYVVLSGMTDEQILIALDDLGVGKSDDKKTGDILVSGDILNALKKKRVTFCQRSGDIPDLENLPDFSVIGKREEVRRKRTTVSNRTVNKKEPSSDSAKSKSPEKKSTRRPGADLTDAMFKAIPTEIRPPKPEYMKHYRKAEELFSAGHTPEQVFDFVDWKYATNDWMWTGSDGAPVIISMGMVANNIKAASGKVKEWIAEGRPRRTQRAQESAKVEKPFDPETDPDNPKNWPKGLTPSPEAIARYAQFVADRMKENANGHTQLYQPGGKDLLPAGAGVTPVAAGQPGQLDLPLVSGHGSGDRERTG